MAGKLYFAYGSNMSDSQMKVRCPGATELGAVQLFDYKLQFNGVATIVKCEGEHVDGLLWRLAKGNEKALDAYEGFPGLYGKQSLTVRDASGREIETMAHVMQKGRYAQSPPYISYLAGIVQAYERLGLDTEPLMRAARESCRAERGRER